MATRYIFVSGGVISGLGKGIVTASVGKILQTRGYRVSPIKCDAYVNLDAGTMNPMEHGEVFVTDDGIETDQDLGHYERFLGIDVTRRNYTTTGQIYASVIERERNLEYEGACVEVVPHVPEELIRRIKDAGRQNRADFVIAEIGGTVGEYQNILFLEAARIMTRQLPRHVIHIHVGYLPIPPSIGEMKSKPVQNSIRNLNAVGIQPDFVVCRSEKPIDQRRKAKIAMFGGIDVDNVIANPDVDSIYELPVVLEDQKMGDKILRRFGMPRGRRKFAEWSQLVRSIKNSKDEVRIGIVGKYFRTGDFSLEDSYVCVIEAIKHAAWRLKRKPVIEWLDAEDIEKRGTQALANRQFDGIIVPQGWGSRGSEGKLKTIQYARENNIPYLGLCYGMQHAVIEYARNVCGIEDANSEEVNPKTKHPVIHMMEHQKALIAKKQYGGTIRLGAYPCTLKTGSLLASLYGTKRKVSERHRHRYEFNNAYRKQLEKAGMVVSGTSPDGKLVEAIEIKDHPFFVATQYHPELKSRPLTPHPLFLGLVQAALQYRQAPRY